MAEQRDVTDTVVFMPEEKVIEIIFALTSDQRRFSRVLADTVQHPHEIFHAWKADPNREGNWLKLRTYLQFLDLSESGIGSSYGVAIVRFLFNKRWELYDMNVQTGEELAVVELINQAHRHGELIYSISNP